ncbi:MAG TPA: prephenate dehydratase [Candidatus Acidoferrales bacterium]|nr:prephenate dehydratase [Candidatus Acidoferrales bacterium]
MGRTESVDALRKRIDQTDEKIVALLNERAALARQIGRSKHEGKEEVYVPSREKQILQRISALNRGPFSDQAIRAVYREILSACRSLEAPVRVAYFGPEATFTHMAARKNFGSFASFAPVDTIGAVFQEVVQGRADYGVVPIENSTEGAVAHTLDMLVEMDTRICAEVFIEVHLFLLSQSGKAEEVRRIVSHPQALAQCRGWLAAHLPQVAVEEVGSTAQAARLAAEDAAVAAIASDLAREVYGLSAIAANIEDRANNMTRFFVIGRHWALPSGEDKTSIACSVKDEVGILYRMLAPFARARINLTKIESRPLKNKPWEYLFFLDFAGHIQERKVQRVLKQLEKSCVFVKVLGSYPNGLANGS